MIVYGSTGSIGANTLALAKEHKLKITALACGSNIKLFSKQIAEFKPKFICVKNEADKNLLDFKKSHIFVGQEGLEEILKLCDDELVVNAIVGFAGLRASLKAAKLGKKLALANKESLVVAGKFFKKAHIIPIDSEHSALSVLLQGIKDTKSINKLYITASGGAFLKTKTKNLASVKAKDALKHPTWTMGAKITIDSATMANKLFEIIEAHHLFSGLDIDALIEKHSLIHALCEFKNGGVSAYISPADMKLAISCAILEKNYTQIVPHLNFVKLPSLKFRPINLKKYPIFSLKNALVQNPDLGVIINGANEVLVQKFLQDECGFLDISKGIFKALDRFAEPKISCLDEIFELDKKVREFTNLL